MNFSENGAIGKFNPTTCPERQLTLKVNLQALRDFWIARRSGQSPRRQKMSSSPVLQNTGGNVRFPRRGSATCHHHD